MKIDYYRTRSAELGRLNVFITLTDEDGDGEVVAVKDLIDVRGTPTSGGGVILPMQPKTHDAPLVSAIRECGCLVIGKTNMHEWAFGLTTINPHYGTVRNPRDERRISGGSSGGSAAAVAAGLCDWAIGTDTGGSVRVPAALCGVVGFKPTFGTVEMTGVLPLSFSLDTIGSLAPDVSTATRGVEMMERQVGWVSNELVPITEPRLAVPAGWVDGLDDTVGPAWEKLASHVPRVPFPSLSRLSKYSLDVLYAEAGAYHRQWITSCPELYGRDVLDRLRLALEVTGADYVEALQCRETIQSEVTQAMEGFDAILLPTTASIAPVIAENLNVEPLARFTRPFNYTGQPVFSLPVPTAGLPVGIQVVGRLGQDAALARVAFGLELAWSAGAASG